MSGMIVGMQIFLFNNGSGGGKTGPVTVQRIIKPKVIEYRATDGKIKRISIERVKPFGSKTGDLVPNPAMSNGNESESF